MFEKIDIGIKTFLRDDFLFHAIQGVQTSCPGARLIIVDDGDQTEEKDLIYASLHRAGHITEVLPFDSGFGRKSNRIAELSTRPYLLIASDDFEFDEKAAYGLSELQSILDNDSTVDIASGRVNGTAYEYDLEITEFSTGVHVKEIRAFDPQKAAEFRSYAIAENQADGFKDIITPWFIDCDLTVNYSLIRMSMFRGTGISWDDNVKIGGGEHGAFFYDCKVAGLRVVCAQDVNINEQKIRSSDRYREYRNRAQNPDRPCFSNREIFQYVLGDGTVDYKRGR